MNILLITIFYMFLHLTQGEYFQKDYVLVIDRIQVSNFNKKYVNYAHAHTFKINRTHTAFNFTFDVAIDFGKNLFMNAQEYRMASNEYRLFPISVNLNVCNLIINNDFGVRSLYSCGYLSKCPMTKGTYTICNWIPDMSRFPPYLPGGKYKGDIRLLYGTEEAIQLTAFVRVDPKNPWEKN